VKYAIVAVLLVLGVGALFAWRRISGKTDPVLVTPSATAGPTEPTNSKIDDVPPPPPVEVKPEAGPGPRIIYVQAGGCEGKCAGTAPPELNQALQVRGMQARRCYNQALTQDPSLKGHVEIAVRIGTAGNVCSVNVTANDMHSPTVANCAAHILMNGGYPAPHGGCVERIVPMSFVAQGQ
jgi:hypothetical protein